MGNICCDNNYQNDYRYPFPISLNMMSGKIKSPGETFNNPLTYVKPYPDTPIRFEPYPDDIPARQSAVWSGSDCSSPEDGAVILSPPIQPRPCYMTAFVNERRRAGIPRDHSLKEAWTSGAGRSRDLAVRRGELRYDNELGKGWFGQVILGTASCKLLPLISPTSPDENGIVCDTEPNRVQQNTRSPYLMETTVIIKMMKEDASSWEKEYFLYEASMYKDLRHPNLVRLLGHCLETHPYLLVYEHCPMGDLRSYLGAVPISVELVPTFPKTVITWLREVASALEYVHRNGAAHGDVAARNVSLSVDYSAKLGDYGLGVSTYKDEYFRCGDVAVPLRWLDPDSAIRYDGVMLRTKSSNPPADVWSFGIFLWEALSLCRVKPYRSLPDFQVINLMMAKTLGTSQLMENDGDAINQEFAIKIVHDPPPNDKKDTLIEIMISCLNSDSFTRPSMTDILNRLLLINTNSYKFQI